MIRIYGDFNHLDREMRVRLDTEGSLEDIRRLGEQLREGLRVVIDSGDYEAEGLLEFVGGIWRARILWETGKDKSENH